MLKNDPSGITFWSFFKKDENKMSFQLFNILLGHMSIVGPRPMVPNTFQKYSKAQSELQKVRPGLTG